MKEYLLLFWNETGENQYQLDPEKMKTNMLAWQKWIGNIAMQGRLISTKSIEWAGTVVSNKGVINKPAIKEKQMVTGYLLCKANNIEEVKSWAATCPILDNPVGFTEIREISPFDL